MLGQFMIYPKTSHYNYLFKYCKYGILKESTKFQFFFAITCKYLFANYLNLRFVLR